MIQSETATEIAQRVHQEAVARLQKQELAESLVAAIRPMVRAYLRGQGKGNIDQWNRLVRLVRMWERG